MSENNQMAISPITSGVVGAAIGGTIGATCFKQVDKAYTDPKALLTMEDDKFEVVKKAAEGAEGEAKTEFTRLENGRKIVSQAGDELIQEQNTARKEALAQLAKHKEIKDVEAVKTEADAYNEVTGKVKTKETELKNARADETKGLGKAEKEFKDAYKTEVNAITNKKDEGLGKELKELEDSKAGKTGDDLAKIEKDIKAKKNEIAKKALENDTVKAKQTAMREEKAKIFTDEAKTNAKEVKGKKESYINKLIATADEKSDKIGKSLKGKVENWKATLAKKVEDVKGEKAGKLLEKEGKDGMKDFKLDKIKSFLPKTWMKPALIGATIAAAVGVALSYIIGEKNPTPKDIA